MFLRGAAPGDLVEAALTVGQPGSDRFLRARVLRVVEPGQDRVEPPCPIVGRCGGCPLQQVTYAGQLHAKRTLVADALHRIGGIEPAPLQLAPVVPSPVQFRYRRRARLHRGPRGSWGFSSGSAADGAVVPVDECLLFSPALQSIAGAVRAGIERLGGLPDVLDLGFDTSDAGKGAVDLRTKAAPTPALRKRARELLSAVPALRGITLGPQGAAELVGEPVLVDAPSPVGEGGVPFRLRSRPDLFAQANRSAVPLLQGAVLEALGEDGEGRLLELFCGAGTLTLPLLARARSLIGVEGSAPALSLWRKSAEEAGLADPRGGEPRLRLITGDCAEVARGLAPDEQGRLSAVLLDPPRTGAPQAVRAAAALRPARIVYVSCDAPTLGRDAKELARHGYRLSRAVPLDLFPQTAHLEVVATFLRS
ncbi:MAG: 23S rRNA (uracil(1939)-C(5))-methyltransferase RlmD [Myxococcales bacterium]